MLFHLIIRSLLRFLNQLYLQAIYIYIYIYTQLHSQVGHVIGRSLRVSSTHIYYILDMPVYIPTYLAIEQLLICFTDSVFIHVSTHIIMG